MRHQSCSGVQLPVLGAENLGELAEASHPEDDNYADLRAALQRSVRILILEEGQRRHHSTFVT